MCHGENGRGGQGYANPIWGAGAQIKKFKNAQGLFEYHQLLDAVQRSGSSQR